MTKIKKDNLKLQGKFLEESQKLNDDIIIKYDDNVQNAIIKIDKKDIGWDRISNRGEISIDKITFRFEREKDAKDFSPVRVGKLIYKALGVFTPKNDHNSNKEIEKSVYINIEEYARECMKLRPDNEHKKSQVLRNFRRELRKDLISLRRNVSVMIESTESGIDDFKEFGLFQQAGIENNNKYIELVFSDFYAKKLLNNPRFNKISNRIFAIDTRSNTTFRLGVLLSRQFSNYSNQKITDKKSPTFDKRRVGSLIEDLGFQDIKNIQNKKSSWYQKLKEPFEKSMNQLVDDYNILTEWHYLKKDGSLLTNDEYRKYMTSGELDYRTWTDWKVQFTLTDSNEYINTKKSKEYKEKELELLNESYE